MIIVDVLPKIVPVETQHPWTFRGVLLKSVESGYRKWGDLTCRVVFALPLVVCKKHLVSGSIRV